MDYEMDIPVEMGLGLEMDAVVTPGP